MQIVTTYLHVTLVEPLLGSGAGNPEIHAEFIAARAMDSAKAHEEATSITPPKTPTTDEDVKEEVEKASTIFARGTLGLHMWDYQVRGFFKESLLALIELGDGPTGMTKWSYKKAADAFLFVYPRRIYLIKPGVDVKSLPMHGLWEETAKLPLLPDNGVRFTDKLADDLKPHVWSELNTNERPLRADTMRGERVALARSEEAPAGTQIVFAVSVLMPGEAAKAKAKAEADKAEKEGAKKRKSSAAITEFTVTDCLDYGKMKGLGQWRSGGFGRFVYKKLTL